MAHVRIPDIGRTPHDLCTLQDSLVYLMKKVIMMKQECVNKDNIIFSPGRRISSLWLKSLPECIDEEGIRIGEHACHGRNPLDDSLSLLGLKDWIYPNRINQMSSQNLLWLASATEFPVDLLPNRAIAPFHIDRSGKSDWCGMSHLTSIAGLVHVNDIDLRFWSLHVTPVRYMPKTILGGYPKCFVAYTEQV